MIAVDLQMNDWVYAENTPVQITSLSILGGDVIGTVPFCSSVETLYTFNKVVKNLIKIKPIPLTEDLLEFNNFNKKYNRFYTPSQPSIGENIEIIIGSGCGISVNDYGQVQFFCEYVHQLQHLLRLCGFKGIADNFVVYGKTD